MPEPVIGYGATLAYDAGGGFVDVGKVVDINGPDISIPAAQATSQDSPDAAHEKIPKLMDQNPWTVNVLHDKQVAIAIYGLARQKVDWKITGPSGDETIWTCKGFWSKFKAMVPLDDVMTDEIEITWSGKPVLA